MSVPQKMEMVQVPEKSCGSFFEGDCYVLLSVSLRKSWGTIVLVGSVTHQCCICRLQHLHICCVLGNKVVNRSRI